MSDDRPILVSEAEIAKRRRITAGTLASFSVDNIPVNTETQHIFDDFVEGKIATSAEVKTLLHAHILKSQSYLSLDGLDACTFSLHWLCLCFTNNNLKSRIYSRNLQA